MSNRRVKVKGNLKVRRSQERLMYKSYVLFIHKIINQQPHNHNLAIIKQNNLQRKKQRVKKEHKEVL